MSEPQDRLTSALIQLLRDQSAVDEEDVRRAMAQALRTVQRDRARQQAAEAARQDALTPPTPQGGTGVWTMDLGEGLAIVIEVRHRAQFMVLGGQIHTGVELDLDEALALDSDVDLCMFVPAVPEEMWFRGRVTRSGRGHITVEVEPSLRDHPQRWNRVCSLFAHSEHPVVPVGAPTEPASRPPRLARGHRRHSSVASDPSRQTRSGANPRVTRSQETSAIRPSRRTTRETGRQVSRRSTGDVERPPRTTTRETRALPATRQSRSASVASRTGEFLTATARPEAPRPSPSLARLLVLLRNKCARIGHADHFTMLGLHWSAPQAKIEAAYKEEMWLLDRGHYPAVFNPVDDLDRHRLSKAIEGAYTSIADPDARRAYRAQLHDEAEIAAAVKVYLDRAEMALFRKQRDAAKGDLQHIIELVPDHEHARRRLRELGVKA